MPDSRSEQYPKKEAKKRLEDALRGAFKTPPTPMASLPRKRAPRKAKKPSGHNK